MFLTTTYNIFLETRTTVCTLNLESVHFLALNSQIVTLFVIAIHAHSLLAHKCAVENTKTVIIFEERQKAMSIFVVSCSATVFSSFHAFYLLDLPKSNIWQGSKSFPTPDETKPL